VTAAAEGNIIHFHNVNEYRAQQRRAGRQFHLLSCWDGSWLAQPKHGLRRPRPLGPPSALLLLLLRPMPPHESAATPWRVRIDENERPAGLAIEGHPLADMNGVYSAAAPSGPTGFDGRPLFKQVGWSRATYRATGFTDDVANGDYIELRHMTAAEQLTQFSAFGVLGMSAADPADHVFSGRPIYSNGACCMRFCAQNHAESPDADHWAVYRTSSTEVPPQSTALCEPRHITEGHALERRCGLAKAKGPAPEVAFAGRVERLPDRGPGPPALYYLDKYMGQPFQKWSLIRSFTEAAARKGEAVACRRAVGGLVPAGGAAVWQWCPPSGGGAGVAGKMDDITLTVTALSGVALAQMLGGHSGAGRSAAAAAAAAAAASGGGWSSSWLSGGAAPYVRAPRPVARKERWVTAPGRTAQVPLTFGEVSRPLRPFVRPF
jgi:hypothetical protein